MDAPRVDTVVTFKWTTPGYRSSFAPETVRVLRNMVARHYRFPHRFVCYTDDPTGLDGIETRPIWTDFAALPSPTGRGPSCYRRLRLFHPEIAGELGRRFVALDLDFVATGDLSPLWHRHEDLVMYGDTHPTTYYNGSMILLRAGSRSQVWTSFDPGKSPAVVKAAGHFGSDQGWISFCLGSGEARWTRVDGVYSFRNHLATNPAQLPSDARAVIFHGKRNPWSPEVQVLPWVQRHYQ